MLAVFLKPVPGALEAHVASESCAGSKAAAVNPSSQ